MPAISEKARAAVVPLVMSGPSGSGKSTLLKKLLAEFQGKFGFSVSHTTRKPRPGEEHGKDYFFISMEEFEKLIEANKFLEHASFGGNRYGTSIDAVKQVEKSGSICILDIDRQGVQSVKRLQIPAKFLFIQPPSMTVLEQRLRGRGTETEDSVQKRLGTFKEDMEYAQKAGIYDSIIVNDDLETAYAQLKAFVQQHYSHVLS